MLAVQLGACSKETEKKENTKEDEINAPRGRYMETVVSAPEGKHMAMEMLEDGTLRAVTTTGIFDSTDKGKTWNPWEKMAPELKEDFKTAVNETYGFEYDKILIAAVSGTGTVFYGVSEPEKNIYKMIAPDGTCREVQLEIVEVKEETGEGQGSVAFAGGNGNDMIKGAVFAGNGDLVYADIRNIYQVDTGSLSLKHKYTPMAEDSQANSNSTETESGAGTQIPGSFDYVVAGEKLFVIMEDYQFTEEGVPEVSNVEVEGYR